jgi:ATP-binding cassette subfamily F protein uup
VTLRRALAPDSDSVIYQDRVTHVAAWAARFLFTGEQLNQPVGRLSGGERARVLIAQLMLQPADVLLLDEPTNDLDIPTLEILEESLLEYRGALVLVTHDRYMLDRVSTVVLGLDGLGTAERFADFQQWEQWLDTRQSAKDSLARENRRLSDGNGKGAPVAVSRSKSTSTSASAAASAPARKGAANKKKLSYNEVRELETIEQRIADAERELQVKHDALHDPAIMSDGQRLHTASMEMEAAQKAIDDLYLRWSELEAKQK